MINRYFIAIVFVLGNLPTAGAALLVGAPPSGSSSAAYNEAVLSLSRLCLGALFILVAFSVAGNIRGGSPSLDALVLPAAVLVLSALVQTWSRDDLTANRAGLIALLLAIGLMRPAETDHTDWHQNLAIVAIAGAIFTALPFAIHPDSVWEACRIDKCIPTLPSALRGQFVLANTAGLYFCLTTFAALSIRHVALRRAILTIAAFATVLSGSRTALFALCFAAASPFIADRMLGVRTGRRLLLGVGLIATTVPALMEFPDSFLTYRGLLWKVAREALANGSGLAPVEQFSRWIPSLQAQLRAAPNPHNLWLTVAWTAGISGVILAVVFIVALVRRIGRGDSSLASTLALALLAISAVEAVPSLTQFDSFTWAIAALFLSSRRLPRSRQVPLTGTQAAVRNSGRDTGQESRAPQRQPHRQGHHG